MVASKMSDVYVHLVKDVVGNVRLDFVYNGGPGETVLNELQRLWEMKMMQVGAIFDPNEKKSSDVQDLNVTYEGVEEYEGGTRIARNKFSSRGVHDLNVPYEGAKEYEGGTRITRNKFSSRAVPSSLNRMRSGRPHPYMQPCRPWMNQRPVSVDMNAAYKEGGEGLGRGISQQSMTQNFSTLSAGKRKREDFVSQYYNGGFLPQQNRVHNTVPNGFQIPQLDGSIPDPYGDLSTPNIYNNQGVVQEDYDIAITSAPHDHASTPAVIPQNVVRNDDDETLNENDDDDFEDGDFEDDSNTTQLVLAQFEKVKKTKCKWTCKLKDGIIFHINNKDILFKQANGEFHF